MSAKSSSVENVVQVESPDSFDLMIGLAEGDYYNPMNFEQGLEPENIEEFLNPDGYFNDILDWNNVSFP